MKKPTTEALAIAHVIRYESRHGRKHLPKERTYGKGCDLVTEDMDGNKRLIEVKSTAKTRHPARWLEQSQYDALSGPDNFWIYLVLEVTAKRAKIRPVYKSAWPKKPNRISTMRWYKIPENLQSDAEEEKA